MKFISKLYNICILEEWESILQSNANFTNQITGLLITQSEAYQLQFFTEKKLVLWPILFKNYKMLASKESSAYKKVTVSPNTVYI